MSEEMDWIEVRDKAKAWILEAGEQLRQAVHSELRVESKSSPDDLVTNMDRQIEQFFIEKIHESYPTHQIVSEEGFGDDVKGEEGVLWLIDPIDGTMNFVHQKRHFAISIGIYKEGVGQVALILDVMNNDLYHCVKGQGAYQNDQKLLPLSPVPLEEAIIALNPTWLNRNRRIDPEMVRPVARSCRGTRAYGSAAIELAYVACGAIDVYFTMRLAPWDVGAGLILVGEVGGITTRVNGDPINLLTQNSFLVGNPHTHEIVVNHIKKSIDEGLYIQSES